jgi:hypothetical protein
MGFGFQTLFFSAKSLSFGLAISIVFVGTPSLLTLSRLPSPNFRSANRILAELLIPLASVVSIVTALSQTLLSRTPTMYGTI